MTNPEKTESSKVFKQTDDTPISSLDSDVLVKNTSPLKTEYLSLSILEF